MAYAIILSPEAIEDLNSLSAATRASVKNALEIHLCHTPTKVSKSRIKRLRGISHPQYRLRIDDIRVFYDITGANVEVLAIVPKSEADKWLNKFGTRLG